MGWSSGGIHCIFNGNVQIWLDISCYNLVLLMLFISAKVAEV